MLSMGGFAALERCSSPARRVARVYTERKPRGTILFHRERATGTLPASLRPWATMESVIRGRASCFLPWQRKIVIAVGLAKEASLENGVQNLSENVKGLAGPPQPQQG